MSIYSYRMANRPGFHWEVPETQSSKNKERTKHIGQMAIAIISALGALLTLTLALAIPIAIGIAIGAIYVYRKKPEPAPQPAPVPETPQNNQNAAPPPYSAPEVAPLQRASSDAPPPPYSNESGANSAFPFWDPSPHWSKNENQVSKSEVNTILNYYGNDRINVSLSFQSPKKATAFLQYVDQMTQFKKIGSYERIDDPLNTRVIFKPLQGNKKQLYVGDLLRCLSNEWIPE